MTGSFAGTVSAGLVAVLLLLAPCMAVAGDEVIPPPVVAPSPDTSPDTTRAPLPVPPRDPAVFKPDDAAATEVCRAHAEAACRAAPACAWVDIYGTVPGGPAAGFCQARAGGMVLGDPGPVPIGPR